MVLVRVIWRWRYSEKGRLNGRLVLIWSEELSGRSAPGANGGYIDKSAVFARDLGPAYRKGADSRLLLPVIFG